ncbi:DUF6801 domain-containing protein [Amycolatopsis balhimycina]|uniref:DUF6801 domain-containing protein n=1 Tax=Amycolatopsis balhimycina TaxID=208443 RepID=UPI0003A68E4A|nr:DUF6801 domain-containing protein [Amycolatopsis balhimycina]
MSRRVRPRSVTVTALAAAGLLSAANGALTGVGSAAPGPAVPPDTQASTSVSVHCPFADPLGPRALTVETTATLPAQAKAGTSATIGAYAVKLSLPREVALSFLPAGATTGALRGTVQLDLAVHQDDRSDKVPVSLVVAPTPLPETGDVVLTATGTVPEIAINTIGAVTFDVTAPTLTLEAVPASDAPPATTAPPKVACTLDEGQQATLGKIMVLPKVTPGTEQKQPAALGGMKTMDEEPPPNVYTQPLGLVSVISNSTVKKLGATVVSTPSFIVNGFINVNVDTADAWITGATAFSPVTVSFLGFGFVPVSATVEFLPVDYQNSRMIAVTGALYTDEVTQLASMRATVQVKARMSHAEINGVPLDLGPDCVTKDPVQLKVSGPYDPFEPGGRGHVDTREAGGFTLPGFSGCSTGGQDLNPLLEGMSSGPGNQADIYLYNLLGCETPDPADCPPLTNPPGSGPSAAAAAAQKAATKPR